MIIALLSCRMVVDFPSRGPSDPSVEPTDTAGPTDPTGPTDTAEPTPTAPIGETPFAEILGEGPGDNIGSGGLSVGLGGGDSDVLWVATPALSEIASFVLEDLSGEIPYRTASARISANSVAAIAASGRFVALLEGAGSLFWLDGSDAAGDHAAQDIASSALSSGDDDDDGGGNIAGIAVGDYDGDGSPDLAAGDPSDRGGEGLITLFTASDGLGAGDLSADDASVQLRGAENGLGSSLTLGVLGQDSESSLVGCAEPEGVCYIVPSGSSGDEQDIDEVATSTIQGGFGALPPEIIDVDGDGESDLLALGGDGTLAAWLSPIAPGARDTSDADLLAEGAEAEAASASLGAALISIPSLGAGALLALPAAGVLDVPGDAALVWQGESSGDRFGEALERLPSDRFAVSAPLAEGDAPGSGVIYLLALPPLSLP